MMQPATLKHVLYNPQAWIHPTRLSLPGLMDTTRCRHIINNILLRVCVLPVEGVDNGNEIERYFIENWRYLPRAAWLMAAHRWRHELAYGGLLLRMDKRERQFILLEYIEGQPAAQGTLRSEAELWQLACQELLLFRGQLSDAVTTRLPLLFPGTQQGDLQLPVNTKPDLLFLRLAVQYAK